MGVGGTFPEPADRNICKSKSLGGKKQFKSETQQETQVMTEVEAQDKTTFDLTPSFKSEQPTPQPIGLKC